MLSQIQNRIKSYIAYSNIANVRQFELHANLPNGFVGKIKNLTEKRYEQIAKAYPDLNMVWLLTGEGSMLRDDVPQPLAQQNNHHSPGARMENNYYMHGGKDGGMEAAQNLEIKTTAEDAKPIIPSYMYQMPNYDIYNNVLNNIQGLELLNVKAFMNQIDMIYRVQDNSMTPTFTNGDLLGIRKLPSSEQIVNGDYYVVDTKPHGMRLRILIEHNESYTMRATDANRERYTDFEVAKQDIISIFTVVLMFRHTFM